MVRFSGKNMFLMYLSVECLCQREITSISLSIQDPEVRALHLAFSKPSGASRGKIGIRNLKTGTLHSERLRVASVKKRVLRA